MESNILVNNANLESVSRSHCNRGAFTAGQVNEVDPAHLTVLFSLQYLQRKRGGVGEREGGVGEREREKDEAQAYRSLSEHDGEDRV